MIALLGHALLFSGVSACSAKGSCNDCVSGVRSNGVVGTCVWNTGDSSCMSPLDAYKSGADFASLRFQEADCKAGRAVQEFEAMRDLRTIVGARGLIESRPNDAECNHDYECASRVCCREEIWVTGWCETPRWCSMRSVRGNGRSAQECSAKGSCDDCVSGVRSNGVVGTCVWNTGDDSCMLPLDAYKSGAGFSSMRFQAADCKAGRAVQEFEAMRDFRMIPFIAERRVDIRTSNRLGAGAPVYLAGHRGHGASHGGRPGAGGHFGRDQVRPNIPFIPMTETSEGREGDVSADNHGGYSVFDGVRDEDARALDRLARIVDELERLI